MKKEKEETIEKFKQYNANSNKLYILNDMAENWNTSLDKVKLQVLLNMYATKDFDPDAITFDDDIAELDTCRDEILKNKNLAIFDVDSAIMCSSGHDKVKARNSCEKSCSPKEIGEEVVILDESKKFHINFAADVNSNKVNSVSWEDIDKATHDNKKVNTIRNALKLNDK